MVLVALGWQINAPYTKNSRYIRLLSAVALLNVEPDFVYLCSFILNKIAFKA
jgi:hypothetical protein